MFRNSFRNRPAVIHPPRSRLAPPRRPVLTLERLEDRTVPTTFTWNGTTSTDFGTATNWTPNGTPGAADTVVIAGGANATVENGSTTVAGITMGNGFITVNGTLTDTGDFNQSQGFVAFGAGGQLQIGGNVNRNGGVFLGAQGTVVLNGTVGQNLSDTSEHQFQNLTISNTSAAGVTITNSTVFAPGTPGASGNATLNAGSTLTLPNNQFLTFGGNFTDNGKIVMTENTPNNSTSFAPILLGGTLTVSATSAFDLTVGGALASGNVYSFIGYGSVSGAGTVPAGNIAIHGNGAFIATPAFGANALTVTLTTPPLIDTWTGAVSNNWFLAGNWSANAVPGSADTAIIGGGAHATVIDSANGASPTIANLQVSGGFLTIQGTDNLSVTGTYKQDSGFVAFGSNANQLQIAGNVTRVGGVFLGSVGTVVFDGTTQTITDTSGHTFGWNVTVNTGDTLTVAAGSVLSVANNFSMNSNSTVNLSMASPASATPLVIGNNLIGIQSGLIPLIILTLGNTSPGLTYIFATFGGTASGSFGVQISGGPSPHINAHSITATT